MRVVFDTNIYVSALVLPGGRAATALRRVLEGVDQLLISEAILDELLGVLARKFARSAEELSRVALLLDDLCERVASADTVTELADEPDNRVLECASAGGAERIVTGGRSMLELREWRGIEIVSLADHLVET